jgi:hypothetical protein
MLCKARWGNGNACCRKSFEEIYGVGIMEFVLAIIGGCSLVLGLNVAILYVLGLIDMIKIHEQKLSHHYLEKAEALQLSQQANQRVLDLRVRVERLEEKKK